MDDIDAQITALSEAIAVGAKRIVIHSGGTRREVEYHSLDDMRQALGALRAQKSGGSRIILAAF